MSEKFSGKNADIYKRYLIAEAAGVWWLYDPEQPAFEYRKPLVMNEFGAEVARRWISGEDIETIIKSISSKSGCDVGTVREDIKTFFDNLHKKGF